MSAPPRSSALPLTAAAEPAAAASSASAGSSRRAPDDSAAESAMSNAVDEGAAASAMDDAAFSAPPLAFASAPSADAAANLSSSPPSASARKRAKRSNEGAAAAAASGSAAPPSRWSTIYSDALHSILKFASLKELGRVLRVSRRWREAVTTLPSIHATSGMGISVLRAASLDSIPSLRSPLARHVSSLGHSIWSCSCLQVLSARMPWLRSLDLTVSTLSEQPRDLIPALGCFKSITHLRLLRTSNNTPPTLDPAMGNAILQAIGGLSKLQTLSLGWFSTQSLSLAPLVGLTSLTSLSLLASDSFTDAQIAGLCKLSWLQELYTKEKGTELLARFLQPGHTLGWRQIGCAYWLRVTEQLVPQLVCLPSLTELKVQMRCSNARFLLHLPCLIDFGLWVEPDVHVEAGELVAALSHCTQLRTLSLTRLDACAADLAQLLPNLPHLTDVRLSGSAQLTSLRALDSPALAASLTRLYLAGFPQCPSAEVVHLLNLRSLQQLQIASLASPVSAELRAQLIVPSARFPRLQKSFVDRDYASERIPSRQQRRRIRERIG